MNEFGSVTKGTERVKLRPNVVLSDTLTINLESITERTFYSLGNFAGEANLTVSVTIPIILCEVVIANSRETIINNSIALLIVFQSKLLREFDAVVEVVDVHTTTALSRAQ
jgi:hypothetical protein